MSELPADDWSPADNPYSIAVSEANWWKATVALTIGRMREQPTQVGFFDSAQIDARTLVVALRQMLMAAKLEQIALADLGIDEAVGDELAKAQAQFEEALPGIKEIRDGLTHFEDWARGTGRGAQATARKNGSTEREVARDFWSFGYDPSADTVTMGPFTISVPAAETATRQLHAAIYTAARSVDLARALAVRAEAAEALTAAGITHTPPDGQVLLSPGADLRVWLSLNLPGDQAQLRHDVAQRTIAAITAAGLALASNSHPQAHDLHDRLAGAEALLVQRH
ncbi:hypothetical protein [Kitasatospora aureofaciens]|uniref:hypothetical protein n=1 Tax=Kitasatospora aureofaciens TaxID=1894 RepID=UPI00210B2C66|nr:hypothetical protein [Kitasatospora aureofaciens]